jgi:DNA invertase Pin-like site-specific DNA recombinase
VSALPAVEQQAVRVAWLGRVSTADQQDPTLSIPSQLDKCRRTLSDAPFPAEIVAHFYDVESGRSELEARGQGGAYAQFDIPVRRDGGLDDLMALATLADRPFDAVICEDIARTARTTYFGTKIEHDLERVGVPLWSAGEGVSLGKVTSDRLLLRRVNQGVAEWYVRKILEQSWERTCEHTRQGWNIGSVPYGFDAEKVPHPVPAKRAEGLTKTRLRLGDAEQADVVRRMFAMRVTQRLAYRTIAARLNADLDRNPPPMRTEQSKGHGRWTISTVRSILSNPKYTGHMVYNRRASSRKSKRNTASQWVWSPEPTHPAIVSRETWDAAQSVGADREKSRADAGANVAHPQTRRSYALRSYVVCAHCGHRMTGKTRYGYTYYNCRPEVRAGSTADHPATIYVREDRLLPVVGEFFCSRIFGADREAAVLADLGLVDQEAEAERAARLEGLRRAVAGAEAAKRNLVRSLETADDPEGAFAASVEERITELERERRAALEQLAALEAAEPTEGRNVALLDALPLAAGLDLATLPDAVRRSLLDAFRLRVEYDRASNHVQLVVTLDDDTLDAVRSLGDVLPFPVDRAQERGGAVDGPGTLLPICDSTRGGSTPTPAFAAGARPNASVPPGAKR